MIVGEALMEGLRVIGGPAIAALVTWLGLRQSSRKTKTDAAQSLFNEVQEERAELKRERTELREEIEKMKLRLTEVERENYDLRDFLQEMRNHIRLEKGPPPPEWPEGLRHG